MSEIGQDQLALAAHLVERHWLVQLPAFPGQDEVDGDVAECRVVAVRWRLDDLTQIAELVVCVPAAAVLGSEDVVCLTTDLFDLDSGDLSGDAQVAVRNMPSDFVNYLLESCAREARVVFFDGLIGSAVPTVETLTRQLAWEDGLANA